MKNFLLPLAMIVFVATAQAQRNGDRQDRRAKMAQNMEPQEMASIQAKKMTLALDLSDKQESQIEEVLLESAVKRKAAMANRKDRKDLTKQERLALAEARMDDQIATKRAFKDILNEEQYAEFEKMAAKRGNKKRQDRKMSRARGRR